MRFFRSSQAFTLVELLVSTAVVAAIMLVLTSVVGQAGGIWRRTSGKIEEFRDARNAFDTLTTRISQATLNTYWDYNSLTLPTTYQRRSELRFICGPASTYLGNGSSGTRITHCIFFHAPMGMVDPSQGAAGANAAYQGLEGLLNVWGYYVELNSDSSLRPAFLVAAHNPPPLRYRFRLMEFRQSSEQMATYRYTSGLNALTLTSAASIAYKGTDWYKTAANSTSAPVRMVAENIVALIITPRLSKQDEQALPPPLGSSNPDYSPLSPNYAYDSTLTGNPGQSSSDPRVNPSSQLPPLLQVTMVAIDEASAIRLNLTATSTDPFSVSGKFSATAQYTADLAVVPGGSSTLSLENALIAKKLNYRIFSTNVPIRAAKWSRDQVN